MASVKVKFRASTIVGQEGTVYYQVIHARKSRQVVTCYHIYPSEWDENISEIRITPVAKRQMHIITVKEHVEWDLVKFRSIIEDLKTRRLSFTADDIIRRFRLCNNDRSLFNYMRGLIIRLRQNGKTRTAEAYASTLNSFRTFRNNEDILIEDITSDLMEGYQAFLQNRNITPNTVSFYMRILRAVYNRAVDNEITGQRNPFRRVYTGMQKTVKRALPLSLIKKIKNMDLSHYPRLDYARDMFMMSFYLRGMSFVDMAYLRKRDLQNGSVVYRRRKTGQQLIIGWTDEMQMILDKYPRNYGEYLLPIIKPDSHDIRKDYMYVGYNINRSLNRLCGILKIDYRLTMYAARHSWASIAKKRGIPVSVISEGLGHDSEITTQIYLASLDTSVIDRANRLVLSLL